MKKLKKHGQVKYDWRELAKNDQRPTEYKQKLTNRLRDGPDRGNKHKDAIDDITEEIVPTAKTKAKQQ